MASAGLARTRAGGEFGDQTSGDGGGEECAARGHDLDCTVAGLRRGVLEEEAAGARPERSVHVFVEVEGRQYDDPDASRLGRRRSGGWLRCRRCTGIRTSISRTSSCCVRARSMACCAVGGVADELQVAGRSGPAGGSRRGSCAWSSAMPTLMLIADRRPAGERRARSSRRPAAADADMPPTLAARSRMPRTPLPSDSPAVLDRRGARVDDRDARSVSLDVDVDGALRCSAWRRTFVRASCTMR